MDKAYNRQACEASLRQLKTDYIDLYQFHLSDDKDSAESAPQVRAILEALVSEGKICSHAWSTESLADAVVFAQDTHCAAVQHRFNIFGTAPKTIALYEV